MDDVVELEADLKVAMTPTQRLVPQAAAPRVLAHILCLTTTPGPSDPAEVAEVGLLAEFPRHDGVQRGRCPSRMQPLLGVVGYERGGEVSGKGRGIK